MHVSVIIPHLQGAELLRTCLTSLTHQTYTDFDVVVVDNASSDGSISVVSEFALESKTILLRENVGFSRAVNVGIRETRGELVLVLNDDTTLAESCLAEVVECTIRHANFGFFALAVYEHDMPGQIHSTGLMLSDRGYGNRSQRESLWRATEPSEVFGACGAAAVFRRRILDEVGLFNEQFFFLYEDQELSYRHQLKGWRCLYIPSAVVYHHGSATLNTLPFQMLVRENIKNSLCTALTCTPAAFLRPYGPRIVGFYLRLIAELFRSGYALPVISAITTVAVQIGQLLQRRQELQRSARLDPGRLDRLLYRGPIAVNLRDHVVTFGATQAE